MNKVISIAKNEVGYLEKKSNSQLENKIANAGSANFTKYGRDRGCNGSAWCDAFVDWCFIKAYGFDKAKSLLGGFSNYTPTSASYFKTMKSWHIFPEVGDVIFFKNLQRICHTGIVYKVTEDKVYTIEGNTSSGSSLVANGGCVAMKSYNKSYNRIAGYGRPNYSLVSEKAENKAYTTIKKGSKGNEVKFLQQILTSKGYKLTCDGIFGAKTKEMVMAYQCDNDLIVDGIVGTQTWLSLTK